MPKTKLPPSKYRLLGIIGQGQFGRVFCGVQRQTGELVALKELPQSSLSTKKFLRELRILLTLNHPNIVTCQGIEHSRRSRYLVMDYCEGGTLRDLIDSNTQINILQKLKLIKDILLGIAHVHQQGIIHRDLKPENILLNLEPRGWLARISDFGISILPEEIGKTTSGMGDTGSPAYMAPEQFYGKYSPSSDIYAIGIILYELLVGKRPFSGTPKDLMFAHINKKIELPEDIPFLLKSILKNALEKLPQHRFSKTEDMIKSIDLSLAALAAKEEKTNLVFPPWQETELIKIIKQTNIDSIINNIAVAQNTIYLNNKEKLYYSVYQKKLDLTVISLADLNIAEEIICLQVLDNLLIIINKVLDNKYKIYVVENKKIINQAVRLYNNLIIATNRKTFWLATASDYSLSIWNIPKLLEIKNYGIPGTIKELVSVDNLHGIAVMESNINNQTPLLLFNRRGNLVKAFTLPITISMVTANENYNLFALEKTEDNSEVIGLIIRLKPLRIKRIALEIKPTFILSQDWGYILADAQGNMLILNHRGDCLKKYQLNLGKITAITALPRNIILIASWHNNQAILTYARINLS